MGSLPLHHPRLAPHHTLGIAKASCHTLKHAPRTTPLTTPHTKPHTTPSATPAFYAYFRFRLKFHNGAILGASTTRGAVFLSRRSFSLSLSLSLSLSFSLSFSMVKLFIIHSVADLQ